MVSVFSVKGSTASFYMRRAVLSAVQRQTVAWVGADCRIRGNYLCIGAPAFSIGAPRSPKKRVRVTFTIGAQPCRSASIMQSLSVKLWGDCAVQCARIISAHQWILVLRTHCQDQQQAWVIFWHWQGWHTDWARLADVRNNWSLNISFEESTYDVVQSVFCQLRQKEIGIVIMIVFVIVILSMSGILWDVVSEPVHWQFIV